MEKTDQTEYSGQERSWGEMIRRIQDPDKRAAAEKKFKEVTGKELPEPAPAPANEADTDTSIGSEEEGMK